MLLNKDTCPVPRNSDLAVAAHDAGRSPQLLGHFSALGYLKSARRCRKHAPRQSTRGRLLICLFPYLNRSAVCLRSTPHRRMRNTTCPMPRENSSRRFLDEASIAGHPGALTVWHLETDSGQGRNNGRCCQIVRMARVSGVTLPTRSICSVFGSVIVRV